MNGNVGSDSAPNAITKEYNLPERGWIVQLLFDHPANLTELEKFARRISAITQRAALCNRQELGHRNRRKASPFRALSTSSDSVQEDLYPLLCQPTQCPICIGDGRKSHSKRTREFSRPSKMMDYVDTHLASRPGNLPIHCHHPIYMGEALVLETLTAFKNHTEKVHGIRLRA